MLESSPNGNAAGNANPEIVIEHIRDGNLAWSRSLADIEDDMQTRYLRAQRSELPFTLQARCFSAETCPCYSKILSKMLHLENPAEPASGGAACIASGSDSPARC